MINGYFAAGGTAAVLVFVLSVTVPAPVSQIPWRLAGWGLAAGVGLLAVMLIWPPRERATLRAEAARGCEDAMAPVSEGVLIAGNRNEWLSGQASGNDDVGRAGIVDIH